MTEEEFTSRPAAPKYEEQNLKLLPWWENPLRAPERKDTNPKDAIGVTKPSLSVLPFRVLWGVAMAFLEGALKYGRHNYRAVGVRASVYFDACQRHLGAWWEGEDLDPDSCLSHIDKAIACLFVLRDGMYQGNWKDDRPPADPARVASLYNSDMKEMLAKYPNPVKPHTEKEI